MCLKHACSPCLLVRSPSIVERVGGLILKTRYSLTTEFFRITFVYAVQGVLAAAGMEELACLGDLTPRLKIKEQKFNVIKPELIQSFSCLPQFDMKSLQLTRNTN